ncbi:hypothetical protein ABT56_07890 [Photobacterium aquae]|uniref:Uncharacterized protein n=1 Tax=Photobacterium aquae TaxID=1195763 RepID=A0A0J1H4X9_9GAMM|nr:hypothetical protein ABT56_07890 [Photobacterium aquae]
MVKRRLQFVSSLMTAVVLVRVGVAKMALSSHLGALLALAHGRDGGGLLVLALAISLRDRYQRYAVQGSRNTFEVVTC